MKLHNTTYIAVGASVLVALVLASLWITGENPFPALRDSILRGMAEVIVDNY